MTIFTFLETAPFPFASLAFSGGGKWDFNHFGKIDITAGVNEGGWEENPER